MTTIITKAYANFEALAIGATFWFRQSDTFQHVGNKPIKAIKVSTVDAVIPGGEVGWSLNPGSVPSTVDTTGFAHYKDHPSFFCGWMPSSYDEKLVVWTSDPTAKKLREKKLKSSLTGARVTLISVPEGFEALLKTGMRGTMVSTGHLTPTVVFDNHPTLRYVHVSHLAVHKPRRKMTKDRLPPQTKQVLALLKAKGSLTGIEAGGVIRARSLPKRISELKEAGFDIVTETKFDHTNQRYARYHLKAAA